MDLNETDDHNRLRLKVVACGVFEPELRALAAQSQNDVDLLFLDAGLHEHPDRLRRQLQHAIDEAEGGSYDVVIAAYGLCGRGTAGIVARDIPIVFLRVHDCITLFLGSKAAYMSEFSRHPGTFYITSGWYEKKVRHPQLAGKRNPSSSRPEDDERFAGWAARFGEDGARFLVRFYDSWKHNYTRAAYIDTAQEQSERADCEQYTQDLASAMGWQYERLDGNTALLADALEGRWDSDTMLVLEPGQRTIATPDGSVLDAMSIGSEPRDRHLTPLPPEMQTCQGADCLQLPGPENVIALGIDAGGTYTDCVVYDFRTRRLLSKAKALTTHHDLSIGIQETLERLPSIPAQQIAMVALSTTLATNSIAEDKGGRPGALLMAPFNPPFQAIKWHLVRPISGAMTVGGMEIEPPNAEQVRQIVHGLLVAGVDAFAISGYGSVRNPSHENTVREIIEQECDLPVICGHHLSANLDYVARANTAILNGRLLGVIHALITAVKSSLKQCGINVPLMVVKGDGSLVNETTALQRPVDTAFSGPAASVVGARLLTDAKDSLVFDMGGTTTDAAVIVGGMPRINQEGAGINGWRTSVAAADIVTIGLGGDSHISFTSDRRLKVGPKRVIPLSYLAAREKSAHSQLMALDSALIADHTTPSALDFFTLGVAPKDFSRLNRHEAAIIHTLQNGPLSRIELSSRLELASPQLLGTETLEAAGYVQRSALTPTDLLHVTGEFTEWDTEAASHALCVFADLYGAKPEIVCEAIQEQIICRLCLHVLTCAANLPPHDADLCGCPLCAHLLDAGLSAEYAKPTRVQFTCTQDLVAIGAPVAAFFPQVAHRLDANLTIPEHAEVANAIGAVASEVIAHEKAVVRPDELGAFVVHSRNTRQEFATLDRAIASARDITGELAVARAVEAGAANPTVHIDTNRKEARIADGTVQLIEISVRAIAAGRPALSSPYYHKTMVQPDYLPAE